MIDLKIIDEIKRTPRLLKPITYIGDTQLEFDGNPNDVVPNNTKGETLLYHVPLGTFYINTSGHLYCKTDDISGGNWDVLNNSLLENALGGVIV